MRNCAFYNYIGRLIFSVSGSHNGLQVFFTAFFPGLLPVQFATSRQTKFT